MTYITVLDRPNDPAPLVAETQYREPEAYALGDALWVELFVLPLLECGGPAFLETDYPRS